VDDLLRGPHGVPSDEELARLRKPRKAVRKVVTHQPRARALDVFRSRCCAHTFFSRDEGQRCPECGEVLVRREEPPEEDE
jgi:hypothetical protein